MTSQVTPLSTAPDLGLTLAAGFRPLQQVAWYRQVQAWALARGSRRYDALVYEKKTSLFSPLEGTIVEVGPGGGANLPFFHRDCRWVGVEPNPFFLPYLNRVAARLGREIEVRAGIAECLPIADRFADIVVSSLVLCSVRDIAASLAEIRRVLRPGGRFVFFEHVAARPGSLVGFAQRVVRPVWIALGDGCHPDRDTATAIDQAGFDKVELERIDLPIPLMGPHIAGAAYNP